MLIIPERIVRANRPDLFKLRIQTQAIVINQIGIGKNKIDFYGALKRRNHVIERVGFQNILCAHQQNPFCWRFLHDFRNGVHVPFTAFLKKHFHTVVIFKLAQEHTDFRSWAPIYNRQLRKWIDLIEDGRKTFTQKFFFGIKALHQNSNRKAVREFVHLSATPLFGGIVPAVVLNPDLITFVVSRGFF